MATAAAAAASPRKVKAAEMEAGRWRVPPPPAPAPEPDLRQLKNGPIPGFFYRRKLPPTCTPYDSAAGVKLFASAFSAGFATSHFHLMAQFRTQDEPSYCGLGTLAMTLNALAIDPKRVWKGVWRWFDETLLDCCKPLEEVKTSGINLEEFVCLARCNGASATLFRPAVNSLPPTKISSEGALCAKPKTASTCCTAKAECDASGTTNAKCCGANYDDQPEVPADGSIEHFRDDVRRATSQPVDRFTHALVVSYNRRAVGQSGTGHFSPIGAYDPVSDSVLILDVARFKYPPHWVSLPLVYKALQSLDSSTKKPRGWVLLSSLPPDSPRCCATSFFYNIHDVSRAAAWLRSSYNRLAEWLEKAIADPTTDAGRSFAGVVKQHASFARFLNNKPPNAAGRTHSAAAKFGIEAIEDSAKAGVPEAAAEKSRGKQCNCSPEDNYRSTVAQIVAEITRTELFALVQAWRSCEELKAQSHGSKSSEPIASKPVAPIAQHHHDHVHRHEDAVASHHHLGSSGRPRSEQRVAQGAIDVTGEFATLDETELPLFSEEAKRQCCANPTCIGHGIGSSLPLPPDEVASSRWEPHVLTVMLAAVGRKVLINSTGPDSHTADNAIARQLLEQLLEGDSYPIPAFPELRRELACVRHRLEALLAQV